MTLARNLSRNAAVVCLEIQCVYPKQGGIVVSIHTITLAQENLIGSFTDEQEPILHIKSGDSIRFQTLDAGWGTGASYAKRMKPFPRQGEKDGGHTLIGPIYIE